MALETVTGEIADFGDNVSTLPGLRLLFVPSGNAVGGNTLFATKPVQATLNQTTGVWSVQLQGTDALIGVPLPDIWYVPRIEWLDSATKYRSTDLIDWHLRVPPGGGEFVSLAQAPTNPRQIWFGPEPPPNPSEYTGWYDTDALPGQPNYFEWE